MGAEDPFATDATEYTPQQVGRYLFRRPLASGGLGVVSIYFDTELNREVALKEIRAECADDSRHQDNFCAEAEVTGLLEHPGVVPIYSMGTSDDGRPYYAMRLITGSELRDDIVRFHKAVKKGKENFVGSQLRQLLQRLIDVCNVIHYAHCRGVLHRDLKSVNVMLGRYGETLVIDWGLAKATGASEVESEGRDASHHTERPVSVSGTNLRHTQAGSAMGTIAYAPPEQLNGRTEEIDSRSDIYSIGAMLYEVLTGDPACKSMNLTEALRVIEAGEIPPPIEVKRETPRPLNAITVKAISASKQQRYQTAEELRDDLQRWLDDEPVAAYQESRWERILRWKRHHETLVRWATASLALVTLISLFAVYRVDAAREQEKRARTEATRLFQLAWKATDSLLTRTSDRLLEIPDTTDVRRQLLQDATESYALMAEVRSNDPQLRRELVRVAISLSDLQFKHEERDDALETLRSAREALGSASETDDKVLLARTFIQESRIRGLADVESAAASISQAMQITDDLQTSGNASTRALLVRGEALIQRGVVASDALDDTKAVESFESAATTLRGILDREISPPSLEHDVRLQLLRAYVNEATMREDEVLIRERFGLATAQAKWLTANYPNDPDVTQEHANLLNNFGDHLLVDRRDFDNATLLYEQSADFFAELVAKESTVPEYKELWTLALTGLGNIASDREDEQGALQYYAAAVDVANRLLEQNPNRIRFRNAAAKAKYMYAAAIMDVDHEQSEALFSEARELVPETDPDRLLPGINYAAACLALRRCKKSIDDSADQVEVDRYLKLAAQRLAEAIKQSPEYWDYALEDTDLELLRRRDPDAFDSMKPKN